MFTALLYGITVVVWGTTWFAISLQLGEVPTAVSIMYRFSIAGIILFVILVFSRNLQKLSLKDHLYTFAQGCCLFCFNFYCFYTAMHYMNSGLTCVVFSTAAISNCFFNRLFYNKKPDARVVIGILIGLAGIMLLFWPELMSASDWSETLTGIALATLGTWFFSLGNMISVRHQSKGLKPPTTNAWGMLYGSLVLLTIIQVKHQPIIFDPRQEYLISLLYLAIPGSVVVFTTYLMLIMRVGADRAAYVTVMFPAIALALSTLYEGYQWCTLSLMGFLLVVGGNIVMFVKIPVGTTKAV